MSDFDGTLSSVKSAGNLNTAVVNLVRGIARQVRLTAGDPAKTFALCESIYNSAEGAADAVASVATPPVPEPGRRPEPNWDGPTGPTGGTYRTGTGDGRVGVTGTTGATGPYPSQF